MRNISCRIIFIILIVALISAVIPYAQAAVCTMNLSSNGTLRFSSSTIRDKNGNIQNTWGIVKQTTYLSKNIFFDIRLDTYKRNRQNDAWDTALQIYLKRCFTEDIQIPAIGTLVEIKWESGYHIDLKGNATPYLMPTMYWPCRHTNAISPCAKIVPKDEPPPQPKYYSCDTSTWTCNEDKAGIFATIDMCQAVCKKTTNTDFINDNQYFANTSIGLTSNGKGYSESRGENTSFKSGYSAKKNGAGYSKNGYSKNGTICLTSSCKGYSER